MIEANKLINNNIMAIKIINNNYITTLSYFL